MWLFAVVSRDSTRGLTATSARTGNVSWATSGRKRGAQLVERSAGAAPSDRGRADNDQRAVGRAATRPRKEPAQKAPQAFRRQRPEKSGVRGGGRGGRGGAGGGRGGGIKGSGGGMRGGQGAGGRSGGPSPEEQRARQQRRERAQTVRKQMADNNTSTLARAFDLLTDRQRQHAREILDDSGHDSPPQLSVDRNAETE